jgi:hypothetical protein
MPGDDVPPAFVGQPDPDSVPRMSDLHAGTIGMGINGASIWLRRLPVS